MGSVVVCNFPLSFLFFSCICRENFSWIFTCLQCWVYFFILFYRIIWVWVCVCLNTSKHEIAFIWLNIVVVSHYSFHICVGVGFLFDVVDGIQGLLSLMKVVVCTFCSDEFRIACLFKCADAEVFGPPESCQERVLHCNLLTFDSQIFFIAVFRVAGHLLYPVLKLIWTSSWCWATPVKSLTISDVILGTFVPVKELQRKVGMWDYTI